MNIKFEYHTLRHPKGTVTFKAEVKSDSLPLAQEMISWCWERFGPAKSLGQSDFSLALIEVHRIRQKFDDTGKIVRVPTLAESVGFGEGIKYEMILALADGCAMQFKLAWCESATFTPKAT